METCLATAIALRPALLPASIAFFFAPAASLRAWTAVKALPAPEALEVDSLKMFKLRRFLHVLSAISVVAIVEYSLFAHAHVAENFLLTCLVFINTLSVVSLLDEWTMPCGPFLWAAYRAPGSGRVLWRIVPGSLRPIKLFGVSAITYYINWQALQTPAFAAWPFAVATAVIFRFSSASQWKTLSIRGVMIVLLAWLALSFAIAGLVVFYLIGQEPSTDGPSESGEPPLSPLINRLTQMLTGALWTAAPGVLISACYRFDHSLSLEPDAVSAVETIETTVCTRRRLGFMRRAADDSSSVAPAPRVMKGVLLPTQRPSTFAKPTFWAAVSSYFVVQVAATALFIFGTWLPEELRTDVQVVDLVGLTFSIPAMVVAVLVKAWAKGNARALWRYREEWFVAPAVVEVGNIRLAEEDSVTALPPYEEIARDSAPDYKGVAMDVKA